MPRDRRRLTPPRGSAGLRFIALAAIITVLGWHALGMAPRAAQRQRETTSWPATTTAIAPAPLVWGSPLSPVAPIPAPAPAVPVPTPIPAPVARAQLSAFTDVTPLPPVLEPLGALPATTPPPSRAGSPPRAAGSAALQKNLTTIDRQIAGLTSPLPPGATHPDDRLALLSRSRQGPAERLGPPPEPRIPFTASKLGGDLQQDAPAEGDDLDALRSELRQTVERLNTVEQELRNSQNSTTDNTADSDAPGDRLSNLETAFDRFEDQLTAERSAKFPSAKLTGFTQLDDYLISQSELNKATVGNAQNAVGFRRARVAVVGNIAAFTAYMVEVDFATAGRPSFFDVWAEQENIPFFGSVRAGQYLQPFSCDAMSGFRHLTFLERSLPFLAFVPFRRVGVMSSVNTEDEHTYLAYSIFRTGGFNNAPVGDSRFATDIGDQGGLSFSTRLTHLLWYDPIAEDRYLWHIGGSYDYSRMTGNTASGQRPFYQARTGPEYGPIGDGLETAPPTFGPVSYAASNFTPPNFIDTGRYLASSFNLYGVETIYQAGPFSFQSEFMATNVNSAGGPILYTGAYGEVMYRLTGEHRLYDKRLASLKNPMPFTDFISLKRVGIQGWGAWEVAGRLSYVTLKNPATLTPADYIQGTNSSGNGTLTDTTLGVSWFWNYHTKLQFNWIHSMLDNTAKGFSLANSYVSRLQIDF